MIDKDIIRENFKYYDKSVIVEIMDIFLSEYPARFEKLQKNIIELNYSGINENAHSLKGIVSYFSPDIAELTRQIEALGKEESSDGLQQTFDSLKNGILQLVEVIKVMRQEYAS